MQKDLQQIHDLVSNSERLNDEDKTILLKAIKSAESDFAISEFKLERTEKVKRTTGILLEETIEELEQKRKAVEAQNRELEVEAALEKVRSSALAMREPAEMLEVCKIISNQLESLGVNNIRNVQTAIFYEDKGSYMNYEYYARHNKTFITETTYTNNKLHNEFAVKMLKGKGEFFITHIKGKKLKEWIDYQKTTNVFIDRYLGEANSLNYYWYSLGPVALGISSYAELNEEELNLFKRFRNVFALAYRRFIDIEQAEAQAKEAQIEAALERVRAKAMAMHKSDDLTSTVATVFSELDRLGLKTIRCGIGIFNDRSRKVHVWTASPNDKSELAYVSGNEILEGHPLLEGIYKSWQKQVDFSYDLKGDDLTEYYKLVSNSNLPVKGPAVNEEIATQHYHCAFFPAGGLFAFREVAFTNEAKHLMKRFAEVFHLTFTRHLDLKQAEAQNKIIQAEHDRKSKELEEARSLQLAMLPKTLPKFSNLEIAVYMKTATEVGGDYYDYCFSDDDSLNICLGDATGHGLKAGIMVSSMKSIFTTNAPKMDIENFFATANSGVKSMNLKRMMMGFVMLNINNNIINMINAGMPPVFIYRKNASAVDEILAHGLPIGAMNHSRYVVSDLSLDKDDVILLMSDGMPELQNTNDEMYGYERIRAGFKKVAEYTPQKIINFLGKVQVN